MNYVRIMILACFISLIAAFSLLLIKYPTYEFYIENFREDSDAYLFDLTIDGTAPSEFVMNTYVNDELVRKDSILFTTKKVFSAQILKETLPSEKSKILFELYSESMKAGNFGSKQKPYSIYKWVDYEEH